MKHTHNGIAPNVLTLGSINDGTGAVNSYIPLNDRTLELYNTFGYVPNNHYEELIPANIADFDRIMRICNRRSIRANATLAGAPRAAASSRRSFTIKSKRPTHA